MLTAFAGHWQTHLPDRLNCWTPLLYTQVQYQLGTGGSYVEKPAKTFRVASGGHEFRSSVWRELTVLSGKILGVRVFLQLNRTEMLCVRLFDVKDNQRSI
jgi:hypothetical protein